MVLPRVITVLVGAPLLLGLIYLGGYPYETAVGVLVLLSLIEFYQMAQEGGFYASKVVGCLAGILLTLAMSFHGIPWTPPLENAWTAFVLVLLVFTFFTRELFRKDKSLSILRIATSLLGIMFVAWPLGHLIPLREMRGALGFDFVPVGKTLTFFLFFILWAQDIMAWSVGKLWGKWPLAKRVSPKKSWEGALAGFLAAGGTALAVREVALQSFLGRWEALFLGFGLGVLGQLSDLFESLLKRSFGVKDSSVLLPGHGGLMDRFDSLLLSAPLLYYYLLGTGRFQ